MSGPPDPKKETACDETGGPRNETKSRFRRQRSDVVVPGQATAPWRDCLNKGGRP